MYRMATPAEREALRSLWQLSFDDPPAFVDWFFANRFLPEYCPVYVEGGHILACLHGLPVHLRLREQILPGVIIAGVSTHPEHRRRGLMHGVLRFFLERLRQEGVPLVSYRPVQLSIYASAGHFPVSDSLYLTLPPSAPRPAFDPCRQYDLVEEASALYRCYARFSRNYSTIVDRSYSDFLLKCQDYRSCGGQCIVTLEDSGQVAGYCIYYAGEAQPGGGILGEECAALSPAAYSRLWAGLARRCPPGRTLTLRLPPDAGLRPLGAKAVQLPRSVWGVADVSALLRALHLEGPGAIQVEDPLLPGNRGIFTLSGKPSSGPPLLRIPAGRLAQWAAGYRTMADILAAGEAEAMDEAFAAGLDRLGTCPCYIVDEY